MPNDARFVLFDIHYFISSWVYYANFFKEVFSPSNFSCYFLCWFPWFQGKPYLLLLHPHQLIMKKHVQPIIGFFNQRRGCIGGINGFRSFENLNWFIKSIFQVTNHIKLYLQPGAYTSNSMLFLDGIRILMKPWKLIKNSKRI